MTNNSTTLELSPDVESRIIKSLKKRNGVATAGDVAADTGIGYEKTEWALQHLLNVYKSHLDVDDSGNLRYRFDPALVRRGTIPGQAWRNFKRAAWKGFMAFFKVWTMVMLIGYTVVFILLLLSAGIAAMSARGEDNRGGGGSIGMLPFMLVGRFLEFMFWWNIFSGPNAGYQRRGRSQRGLFGGQRTYKRPSKAFYQKIFDYLFGPQPAAKDPLAPGRAFAQFARSRGGRITAADWASRTGQSLEEAGNALTASLVRFSGDVDVTEEGALVYRFDNLVVTAHEAPRLGSSEIPPIWHRPVTLPSFTGNPKSSNVWITIFNAFNLIMACAVLFVVQGIPLAATIGLGVVPLVFSAIFFAIPLLRKIAYNRDRKKALAENERRQALSVVFESAEHAGRAKPVAEQAIPPRFQERFLVDYAGDISVTDNAETIYTFPQVATELEAGRAARESAEQEVVFGKTVFSSDEEEKSLDEAEMEDFDRRLARELGGDIFEMNIEQSVGAEVGRY